MSLERTILPILDPTIKVDPLMMEDQESADARASAYDGVSKELFNKNSSRAGAWEPVVAVRSNMFDATEIRYLCVSLAGKIPRVTLTIKDVSQKFLVNFPLDGDVLSVYLRPPDIDNQRPIRIDFDILSVNSIPSTQTYSFSGIMKIPGFFGETCKSFPASSSFEHIQDVCEEVGLGFASNENSMDDVMSRICPFETYETFIQQTVQTAYKNDDSFFTWYIDPYYYLCLVNVNKQFSLEDKIEDVNISYSLPLSGIQGQDDTKDTAKGSLVLTNKLEMVGMNTFIEQFSLENNSANVWIENGYKRHVQYYDMDANSPTYVTNFVDPLTTDGAESEQILLKGRRDEDTYQRTVKYKWIGTQFSKTNGGHVHDNYIFARILNFQNLAEIEKMTLKVNLAGMNFYLSKYARVPVLIYQSALNPKNAAMLRKRDEDLGENTEPDPDRKEALNKLTTNSETNGDGTNPTDQIKNEFLSGYYVIGGIDYKYTPPGPMKQSLVLIRREWPIPARNKDV